MKTVAGLVLGMMLSAILPASAAPVSAELRELQAALAVLDYRPGPADGKAGPRTAAAIEAFQRDHKLPVTGKPSARLNDEIDRVLTRAVQQRLAALGYDPGPVDGKTGPRTEAAIRAFSKQWNLPSAGDISADLLVTLARQHQAQNLKPVRRSSVDRGGEIVGTLKVRRNRAGALLDCQVRSITVGRDWCEPFAGRYRNGRCKVLLQGEKVIGLSCG